MGSGEAWRWGLLTPQAEGATWGGGGAPHRGFPVGSAWALVGASAHSGHGAWPAPGAPCGGPRAGQGAQGGPHGRSPLHSTFGPWCCQSRWPRGHRRAGRAPQGPQSTHAWVHAHPHTHTHTGDAVCPSVHPFQVVGPGRRDQGIMARQRQHGGLGSVLTLMGARLAGRGPSRPRASASGWGRGQQVVSEHGVVPRGAGAGGVLAARRVLLEGH